MKLRVVYNANIWRSLGASGAMWTTPGYAPHAAGWPARDARRGVESPRHSEAQESSRSLEGRQAARYGLGQHFFWCLLSGELGSPQPCQQRIGPHGSGDVPVPSRPTPHFILIEADLALRLFKALVDCPPPAGHLRHGREGGRFGSKHDIRRQLSGITETASDQQPATPRRQAWSRQWEPAPIIPARAFCPVPDAQPAPAVRPQRGEEGFDLVLSTGAPDIFFP